MKTCSVRSKRRDQYQSDNRETNDKTKPFVHVSHVKIFLQFLWISLQRFKASLKTFIIIIIIFT